MVESAWTLWAPCCLALQVGSAARLRSIAGCLRRRTSSLSWKGRIQGTAMGTPASMSLTSQGISLPWKSGGRCPARPAPPRPAPALLLPLAPTPTPPSNQPCAPQLASVRSPPSASGSPWLGRCCRAVCSSPSQVQSDDAGEPGAQLLSPPPPSAGSFPGCELVSLPPTKEQQFG